MGKRTAVGKKKYRLPSWVRFYPKSSAAMRRAWICLIGWVILGTEIDAGDPSQPSLTYQVATLGNISTRLQVGSGDRVMIAGFIVQGSAPKKVLIRAAGPSLKQLGVSNALVNPRLELHDTTNTIGTNNDWQTTQIGGVITSDQVGEIQNSGLAPGGDREAVVIGSFPPGQYTAIVRGKDNATGIALVEAYKLN